MLTPIQAILAVSDGLVARAATFIFAVVQHLAFQTSSAPAYPMGLPFLVFGCPSPPEIQDRVSSHFWPDDRTALTVGGDVGPHQKQSPIKS
jgi:hypothetical protein